MYKAVYCNCSWKFDDNKCFRKRNSKRHYSTSQQQHTTKTLKTKVKTHASWPGKISTINPVGEKIKLENYTFMICLFVCYIKSSHLHSWCTEKVWKETHQSIHTLFFYNETVLFMQFLKNMLNPEINIHTYSQLTFDKGGGIHNREKIVFSASGCWESWTAACKSMKLEHMLKPHKK